MLSKYFSHCLRLWKFFSSRHVNADIDPKSRLHGICVISVGVESKCCLGSLLFIYLCVFFCPPSVTCRVYEGFFVFFKKSGWIGLPVGGLWQAQALPVTDRS
jgi:hypothetical protein